MQDNSKKTIEVSDLQYYFDAQERDTLDKQGYSRRSSDMLTIRDRILALPERDYNGVVQTIKNILSKTPAEAAESNNKNQRRDAGDLYEKTRKASSPQPKVNPV